MTSAMLLLGTGTTDIKWYEIHDRIRAIPGMGSATLHCIEAEPGSKVMEWKIWANCSREVYDKAIEDPAVKGVSIIDP